MATTMVSPVAVNSQGADVPSVTRIPAAAVNVPGAVSISAQTEPAKNTSGGATTTPRRPLVLV
jgi:hypothetical protein